MSSTINRGVELKLLKSDYKFGFFFDSINDNRVWIVSHNRADPNCFILTERRNGEIVSVKSVRYDQIGPEVRDLCGLYKLFITRPSEAVKKVIGEEVGIVGVKVKDISTNHENGFETCSSSL